MPDGHQRLLVISPVRNEAAHFERVARAMAAQTRPPDTWVVIDDGSTDGTPELVERLAQEIPFIVACTAPHAAEPVAGKDRLARAAAPRNFNAGLRMVDWESYTHISKLDGDMELPPEYWERILGHFADDHALGIAGGLRTELVRGEWEIETIPLRHQVNGALKCWSLECFKAFGGVQERLGWDTIDQVYARMHGFKTRSYADLVAIHHRPWASADGTLRGRARSGEAAYIVQFPFFWVAARSVKIGRSTPAVLSGLAFLYGYLRAAATRRERVEDPEFRRFARRELRKRVRSGVATVARRPRAVRPAEAA
jgi:poly-beta-1,6-N-acetyl-D-glucosamine synthase